MGLNIFVRINVQVGSLALVVLNASRTMDRRAAFRAARTIWVAGFGHMPYQVVVVFTNTTRPGFTNLEPQSFP